MKLDLDASCNESGPNLSSNLAPYFLIPIIIKCIKLVTMEAWTFFDYGTSTCSMDKEPLQQYKLALVEKNTQVLVQSIDGRNLSSKLITHETKPLNVTIGPHTSKVVFNVISCSKDLNIIGLS